MFAAWTAVESRSLVLLSLSPRLHLIALLGPPRNQRDDATLSDLPRITSRSFYSLSLSLSFSFCACAEKEEPPGRGWVSVGVIGAMFFSEVYICWVDCEFTEVLDLPLPGPGGSARCCWNGCGRQCSHPAQRADQSSSRGPLRSVSGRLRAFLTTSHRCRNPGWFGQF